MHEMASEDDIKDIPGSERHPLLLLQLDMRR